MATSVTARPVERYLGNSDSDNLEVHDLQNESANCQIDEIIDAGNAVVSRPTPWSRRTARATMTVPGA